MDWPSLASFFLEHFERPALVVDSARRVKLVNEAMERLVGWRRHELLGKPLATLMAADERGREWAVVQAFRGVLRRCQCVLVTRDQRHLNTTLDLAVVGGPRAPSLVCTVSEVRPAAPSLAPHTAQVQYGVSSPRTPRFGIIKYILDPERPELSSKLIGQECFRALHGLEAFCAGCPAATPLPDGATRVGVLAPAGKEGPLRVVTAFAVDTETVSVTVNPVSDAVVSGLVQARLKALAQSAGLSEREREVLDLMLIGRSIKEMAMVLNISARTIKFHQTNILSKLGADSRLDLIRLIL